ncbi:MAG: response regulator [Magnetococcales bacterium]|nr:response regulator [Magnetococcales bacterium]
MKTALVIEDNDDNMELIVIILESCGYGTIRAYDGLTGVQMAGANRPDFIILDIQLPDILGMEVLERIRDQELQFGSIPIPVIAMTSYAMSGDRARLLAAGCNGYIEKPIDPEYVIEQIRGAIGEL